MVTVTDETEVARAKRSWSPQYKLKILTEIDQVSERGRVGEICRREGLYSSLIDAWRRQRDVGALEGLRDRKTGPKPGEAPRAELATHEPRSRRWKPSWPLPRSWWLRREKSRRSCTTCRPRAPQ